MKGWNLEDVERAQSRSVIERAAKAIREQAGPALRESAAVVHKIWDGDVIVGTPPKRTFKVVKFSREKASVEWILAGFNLPFVKEHQFLTDRKFRFDYALVHKRIAIEYEGVMNGKSRHTTIGGYSKDTEKYNLATLHGWKVLRYTAKTYRNLESDLRQLLPQT